MKPNIHKITECILDPRGLIVGSFLGLMTFPASSAGTSPEDPLKKPTSTLSSAPSSERETKLEQQPQTSPSASPPVKRPTLFKLPVLLERLQGIGFSPFYSASHTALLAQAIHSMNAYDELQRKADELKAGLVVPFYIMVEEGESDTTYKFIEESGKALQDVIPLLQQDNDTLKRLKREIAQTYEHLLGLPEGEEVARAIELVNTLPDPLITFFPVLTPTSPSTSRPAGSTKDLSTLVKETQIAFGSYETNCAKFIPAWNRFKTHRLAARQVLNSIEANRSPDEEPTRS